MLSWIDSVAIAAYFAVLLFIGIRIMRRDSGHRALGSFLAADRNMGLVQTTASTAATDLGGGFSIAMGGLGFTLGISGSWLIAMIRPQRDHGSVLIGSSIKVMVRSD